MSNWEGWFASNCGTPSGNLQAVGISSPSSMSVWSTQIESLRGTDLDRAKALEQEVLYYVRQNVGDPGHQGLTINATTWLASCARPAEKSSTDATARQRAGHGHLSIAVTLARATGADEDVEMLAGSRVH